MASIESSISIVDKPINDNREYRFIKFENELEAILISDPDCDRAACALSVEVGSIFDPSDLEGLAHFLEHMLFLGTEKYPDENEYNKYLQQHGGSSNAYTTDLNTLFHFGVAPEHLGGALDRFAQFFLTPLFTPSATDRELDAVHSEHTKNLLNDDRRNYQLIKHLANPNHPFHHFGTGNNETLRAQPKSKGIDIRTALLNFYNKYYSANIMKLCILGRSSLDELETLVRRNDLFCQIVNKHVQIPKGIDIGNGILPFQNTELQKLIKIIPVKDFKAICFDWVLPEQTQLWKTKPTHYISHLLGHEGKGSLLSALKTLKLATELCAGVYVTCSGMSLFQCRIDLTTLGAHNIATIGYLVHDYIRLIRDKHPIQNWFMDELIQLANIEFKFMSKCPPTSLVVDLANDMHYFPPEYILSGPHQILEVDDALITTMLGYLTPNNLNIFVIDKEFELNDTWLKEPYYGMSYYIESIPEDFLNFWLDTSKKNKLYDTLDDVASVELAFPERNIFMPKDLTIKSVDDQPPLEYPKKLDFLRHDQLISVEPHVYFKQDSQFKLPKGCVLFQLSSAFPRQDVLSCTHTELYCLTIEQLVNEYAYAAKVAGLHYTLSSTISSGFGGESIAGIELELSGFNDALPALLKTLCLNIASPSLTQKAFNVAKTILVRALNIRANNLQPYQQTRILRQKLMTQPYFTPIERLEAAQKLEFTELMHIGSDFLKHIVVEGLIQGNFKETEARNFIQIIDEAFSMSCNNQKEKDKHTDKDTWNRSRVADFTSMISTDDDGNNIINSAIAAPRLRLKQIAPNPEERNNAVSLAIQVGVQTIQEASMLNLTSKYIHQPFFHCLRTGQQLGYIVACSCSHVLHCDELVFLVQSQWLEPSHITERIEGFIEYYLENIDDRLSEDEFDKLRMATISILEEKPKNLGEEVSRHYKEVARRRFAFNRYEKQCEFLRALSRNTYIHYVKDNLLKKPWILAEVFGPNVCDKRIGDHHTSTEHGNVPLAPTKPSQWIDVSDNYEKFVNENVSNFFEFPLPGNTQ